MTAQETHIASTKLRRAHRGFTLAEAMIAAVFLAITAMGIAGALAASANEVQLLAQSSNCQSLARELIEEVSSKSFAAQPNKGWSFGITDRSTYDDVGDYNGYTDNTTSGIKTLQGTLVSFGDGATYTRTVAFEYRASPNGIAAASGDFGMITVTVSSGAGVSSTLQRLLSNSVIQR